MLNSMFLGLKVATLASMGWLGLVILAPGEGALEVESAQSSVFFSVGKLEPDKLASAWLIKRFVNPEATVHLLQAGDAIEGGKPFDMPLVAWSRNPSQSTFEVILLDEGILDAKLQLMGELVHASEILFWSITPGSPAFHLDQSLRACSLADDMETAFVYLDDFYSKLELPNDKGRPLSKP